MKSIACIILLSAALLSCLSDSATQSMDHIESITSEITDKVLENASGSSGDWITHGLTYKEDRFSPVYFS